MSFDFIASCKGFPEMSTAAAELTPSASPGMNGMPPTVNGNGVSNGTHGHHLTSTKAKIFELTSYSSKLETVLLALLKDQQDMLDKFEAFQSVYERDKDEHEAALHNLNDRLESEVESRESSNKALEDTIAKTDQQSKDLAASLDRKIDESQKSSDERASRIEEALKNTKDDLLAKISQATADLEDKTKREIEATRDEVTKDLSQKIETTSDDLRGSLCEMERNTNELLGKEGKERERVEADLKMALEEEKMLRGQDMGILKFNLSEGVKEIKEANDAAKAALDKSLEEERDERQGQAMDLLEKLDRDKREKSAALADLGHQLEAEVDRLKSDTAKDIIAAADKEAKARQDDVAKLNKDLDDLHEASLKEIRAVAGDLNTKINAQDRSTDEKFKAWGKTLEEDNQRILKKLDDQKQGLEDKIDEERKIRTDGLEDLNGSLGQVSGNVDSLKQSLSDVTDDVTREKASRASAETLANQKMAKLESESREAMEGLKSDLGQKLEKESTDRAQALAAIKEEVCQTKTGFEEDMRKAREETMSLVSAETDNRKSDKAEILDNVEKVRQGAMDKVADKCKALQDIIGALEAKTAGEKQLFDDEIGSLKNTIKTGLQERENESKLLNDNFSAKFEGLRLKTDELCADVGQENERRKQESLDIKAKMEREKQELQDYIAKDNADLRDRLEKDKAALKAKMDEDAQRQWREREDIRNKLAEENEGIQARIDAEMARTKAQLEEQGQCLRKKLEDGKLANEELQRRLDREKAELSEQVLRGNQEIEEKLRSESKQLKDKLEGESKHILGQLEREKEEKLKETKRLEEEMANDKMSLAEKLRAENEALAHKMRQEAENRAKRDAEIKAELDQSRNNNKSEILELFDRVKRDLEQRKVDTDELGKKLADGDRHRMEDWRRIVGALNTEKRKLQSYLDHQQSTNSNPQVDTSSIDFDISSLIMELDRRVRRSGDDLKALNDGLTAKVTEKDSKIAGLRDQTAELRDSLSADLRKLEERASNNEEFKKCVMDRNSGLESQLKTLRDQVSVTMREVGTSIYFSATRDTPYTNGGEEYLTFSSCPVNVGGAMDPGSGVFTAPVGGVYLVALHVCTHDMKKALISVRRNGKEELATVYDQNHNDNHKNSMAGTCTLARLHAGDKVQVYMYTFTGLHDKPGNSLTQFTGCLMKAIDF